MRFALLASMLLFACQPAPVPAPTPVISEEAPDFSLTDVAPESPRFGQQVSPRDYLGKVSGWYFGHSG
jgi:hypothetical protein